VIDGVNPRVKPERIQKEADKADIRNFKIKGKTCWCSVNGETDDGY